MITATMPERARFIGRHDRRLPALAAALAALFGAGLIAGDLLTADDPPSSQHARRVIAAPSALAPLSPRAFRAPVAAYRTYVLRELHALAGDTRSLMAALAAADRTRARAAWRRAYGSFGRLGSAYGAFGKLGAAIDDGLHRIEHGLWTAGPLDPVSPLTAGLTANVERLRVRARTLKIGPLDYALRAHEVLELAKRDQLGGRVVQASGEGVLGLSAAVDATDEVLLTLRGLLGSRAGAQQPAGTALVRLHAQLDAVHRAHRGYPPLAALTHRERALLIARTDAALEALARIPQALETAPATLPPSIGRESR
jgi:iron uptake system component EfeO